MTSQAAGREEKIRRYMCSFDQAALLRKAQRNPDDPGLNATMRWRVRGELPHQVLERAWGALAARHEMLRTRFETAGERLEQVVESALATHVPIVDCSALASEIVEGEIVRIASMDARAPFDPMVAPLWRLTRLVLSPIDSVLLVTASLLTCDGWSFGIIARELGLICSAYANGREPELAPLTTTFGAFASWQRAALTESALAEELGLLRSDLKNESAIDLPTDLARPTRWTSSVSAQTRPLDTAVTRRYLDEARALGSTPFVAMLAAAAVVLLERSPVPSLTITTQVVGRDDVDLESVIGPFVNSMPLRLAFHAAASVSEVVTGVGELLANALELRHVPFAHVVEQILPPAGPNRGATCGVNFLYQKAFTQDSDYGVFRIESEHSMPGGSQYDLNLYVVERAAGWRLSCDYNPDLYTADTVSTILDRLEQTIAGGIDRREPVLFFHSDLFAGGYYAEAIAAAVHTRRIIPIGPHGIGERPLRPTISAMAQDYVDHIDAIQPAGPYRLLGFCSGALVAFEVARLLRERGELVKGLTLINATAPVRAVLPLRDRIILATARNVRLSPRVREIVCYNVARFNRALIRGPWETARFVRGLVLGMLRSRQVKAVDNGETFVRSAGESASEISFAHIGAALSHHPHLYDGEVTLVWSVDQVNLTGDPTQGWHRLARSVDVIPMRGGHVAPLHDLVGELSEILRSSL